MKQKAILTDFYSIKNTQIQVIGSELIFGTLHDRIGYGTIDNEMFRHMVICPRKLFPKALPLGWVINGFQPLA
jgi:hypothetical protein